MKKAFTGARQAVVLAALLNVCLLSLQFTIGHAQSRTGWERRRPACTGAAGVPPAMHNRPCIAGGTPAAPVQARRLRSQRPSPSAATSLGASPGPKRSANRVKEVHGYKSLFRLMLARIFVMHLPWERRRGL